MSPVEPLELYVKLAGKNAGAGAVLSAVILHWESVDPGMPDGAHGVFKLLDDLYISERYLWFLFKDVCSQDIRTFFVLTRAVQLDLIPKELLTLLAGRLSFGEIETFKRCNPDYAQDYENFKELEASVMHHSPTFLKKTNVYAFPTLRQ